MIYGQIGGLLRWFRSWSEVYSDDFCPGRKFTPVISVHVGGLLW